MSADLLQCSLPALLHGDTLTSHLQTYTCAMVTQRDDTSRLAPV